MNLEIEVSRSLEELASSVIVSGPFDTGTHLSYKVTGLADTEAQFTNLSWYLLGFVGRIYEIDFCIDSVIGSGAVAERNLTDALEKRLDVGKTLTPAQKERKRDPLLQELISHTLVHIQRSQVDHGNANPILREWLGIIQACARPHLSPNDSGIDMIAIGAENNILHPVFGEVKAYEQEPLSGLIKACGKFSEIRRGDYNDEIRTALKEMDRVGGLTRDQLAKNIWNTIGRFGAIVGHDDNYECDLQKPSKSEFVVSQPSERLFFITTPFASMRDYFDCLTNRMLNLARSVGR